MAENVTPVVLKVKDFAPREVLLVNYKFNPLNIYNYGNNTSSNEDPGLQRP